MGKWTRKAGEAWAFNSYIRFVNGLMANERPYWDEVVNNLVARGFVEIKPERGKEKLFLTKKGEEELFDRKVV